MISEVNWAAVWKARMTANQQLKEEPVYAGLWESRSSAKKYDAIVRSDGKAGVKELQQRMDISPSNKVLDIGAGPGTHAIWLSRLVDHVLAVEPATGMFDVLGENLERESIKNVSRLRKKWETIALDELDTPYDIVLASLSLGMPDIRPALEKMDRACSGNVYLVWPAGLTPWGKSFAEAWPLLHGIEYVPGPKADVLFNTLYQMGICPDVQLYVENYEEYFQTLDEAIDYYRPMYCASTPEKEIALIRYLGKKLNRSPAGFSYRGIAPMAIISWDVMTNRITR